MTIEEFNKIKFGAGMKAKYKDYIYGIVSVNFEESLLGLADDDVHDDDDDLIWVRCENAEIVNHGY